MNKLDILKGVSEVFTSIGVSAIVGNVIKLTADPDAGKIKKVAIGFGGFVLSSLVADKAVDYANDRIDSTAASLKKIFHPADEDKDESPEDEASEITIQMDGHVYLDGIDITDHPDVDAATLIKAETIKSRINKKDSK